MRLRHPVSLYLTLLIEDMAPLTEYGVLLLGVDLMSYPCRSFSAKVTHI